MGGEGKAITLEHGLTDEMYLTTPNVINIPEVSIMAKIGMVGVGCISGIYLENITKVFNKEIELVAVCDLVRERAENASKNYHVPKIYDTMYELFADPEIEVVLNLTRPYEHYGVSRAALEAGKHVYSEKPLGASFEEGQEWFASRRKRTLDRRRAGYLYGRGHSDLPQGDRFGRDRQYRRREREYDLSRSRVVASRSGILL